MDRIKRNERLGAMTEQLLSEPNRIHTLGSFCERFGAAKSSISEDIDILRQSFDRFQCGELTTIAGAAGGVRYRATMPKERASTQLSLLAERLTDPSRILPGGFLYTADVTAEPDTSELMGRILAQHYYAARADMVLTMETKGIPIALMTARMLSVPLVIARRDSRAYEGPAVKINYVAGSGAIATMALARRTVSPGQRVLIIDDFMKGGGTLRGMMDMMAEFQATVVGVGVMIKTAEPVKKRVDGALSLLTLDRVDAEAGIVKIAPSEAFS